MDKEYYGFPLPALVTLTGEDETMGRRHRWHFSMKNAFKAIMKYNPAIILLHKEFELNAAIARAAQKQAAKHHGLLRFALKSIAAVAKSDPSYFALSKTIALHRAAIKKLNAKAAKHNAKAAAVYKKATATATKNPTLAQRLNRTPQGRAILKQLQGEAQEESGIEGTAAKKTAAKKAKIKPGVFTWIKANPIQTAAITGAGAVMVCVFTLKK